MNKIDHTLNFVHSRSHSFHCLQKFVNFTGRPARGNTPQAIIFHERAPRCSEGGKSEGSEEEDQHHT